MRLYILRLLVAGDILINVLIGGKLYETLSASAWSGEVQGKLLPRLFRPIIDKVFSWLGDKDHCKQSYWLESTKYSSPFNGDR